VPLLAAAATAAVLGIGLNTAASAAADTTSVSTPSSEASGSGPVTTTTQNLPDRELQIRMQSENRPYTAVSNIMKTKHHTVKNSIGNIH
jgi:hypothetical protein